MSVILRTLPMVLTLSVVMIISIFAGDLRGDVRIETMDMRMFEGQLVSIAGGNVSVMVGSKARKFPSGAIADIFLRPARPVAKSRGHAVIMTSLGERIVADKITISAGKMQISCLPAGKISRPLGAVKAVYMPLPSQTVDLVRARCGSLGAATASGDVVVVAKSATQWVIVDGVIKEMDSDAIMFEWKGKDRRISRDKVRAILPANAAGSAEKVQDAGGMLVAVQGTQIAFKSITYSAGVFKMVPLGGKQVSIDADQVSAVRFISPEVVDLVDLSPSKVVEHGFLDRTVTHRVGSNVLGGPLKIKGQTYVRGLGLHSYCELTYKLDGKYTMLACMAGIDASSGPCGDVDLEFIGDGKPLLEPTRLMGGEEARRVAVKLDGVKVLVIRAGFGKDKVDVGDRVNIVSARLKLKVAR